MSVVKVEGIAFVRFRAPDLVEMRSFLDDFGLAPVREGDGQLFSRAAGSAPVVHIAELGQPGFIGLGLQAAHLTDLEALARHENVAIAPFDAPGGGYIVSLIDPDGNRVEVVAGQTPTEPLPLPDREPWNSAASHPRLRTAKRMEAGPAHVLRLGHAVLNVSDFRTSERWYKDRFGLLTSDEVALPAGLAAGAFLRCDRGDVPTDHHTLFMLQHPEGPGFNHAAFEVADLDDLMLGHEHLKEAGRKAEWGIGRHILGSQVFDYWRDPWGHTLEHWTDGDLFTAADAPRTADVGELLGVQWGPAAPVVLNS